MAETRDRFVTFFYPTVFTLVLTHLTFVKAEFIHNLISNLTLESPSFKPIPIAVDGFCAEAVGTVLIQQ